MFSVTRVDPGFLNDSEIYNCQLASMPAGPPEVWLRPIRMRHVQLKPKLDVRCCRSKYTEQFRVCFIANDNKHVESYRIVRHL